LAGKSDVEKARADQVVDQLNDLFTQYAMAVFYETDETKKKEKIEKLYAETFPTNLEYLEKLIKNQNTKFFASNEITWADLIFSASLDRVADKKEGLLAKFPGLKAIDQAVLANPKIAEWIKTRPASEF